MNNRMGLLALIAAIALVLGSSVRSEDMTHEEMMKKMVEGYAKWSKPTKHHKAMGKDSHGFALFGFDPYKKKHVACFIDNMNTGMLTMEGVVVDPTGKLQVSYGTMDEWMTGDHDKAVKYVTRTISDDEWVFEIWDLGIGENGKAVVIERFTRKKAK